MSHDTEEILTIEDVSDILKISKEAVYQNVRRGTIPAKKIGHQWRIIRSQLMTWLQDQ